MKKKVIFIVCLFVLMGCSTVKKNPIHESMLKENSEYLNMTYTHVVPGSNQLMTDIYYHKFNSKRFNKITEIPYKSQYPVIFYDRSNNKIYYSKKYNGSEQLYCYDLIKKKDTRLTENLFGINAIFKVNKRKLFIISGTKGVNYCKLFEYDLIKKKCSTLYRNTFAIEAYYFSIETGLYLAGGDQKKIGLDDLRMNDIEKNNYSHHPLEIYHYDINKAKWKLIKKNNSLGYISSFVVDEKNLYLFSNKAYRRNEAIIDTISYFCKINLKTGKICKLKNSNNYTKLLAVHDHKMYCVEENPQSLHLINLKNKEDSVVFHKKVEGAINNVSIGYGDL